jgi:hypothetical protein
MSESFFDESILVLFYVSNHGWELSVQEQLTQRIIEFCRRSNFISTIPDKIDNIKEFMA